MTNSIYQLFTNLKKMDIPDRYWVHLEFRGKFDIVVLSVYDSNEGKKISWAFSLKELEAMKLDFIKDNIEAMIDHLQNDIREE